MAFDQRIQDTAGEHNVASVIILQIERAITRGTMIPKPYARNSYIVKGWGVRRGERALIYTIPNHLNPTSPYEKGITVSEWMLAASQLLQAGAISRFWFENELPACSREGGCNFTTIGGVFALLRCAAYEGRGLYRRTVSRESHGQCSD